MPKGDVEVKNIPANQKALKRAGEIDSAKAGTEAARNMLPFVQSETRVETGALRAGWIAEEGFINEVEYAMYQEFGTVWVAPTLAVGKTIEQHGELITEAFESESERAAAKAGLGSK